KRRSRERLLSTAGRNGLARAREFFVLYGAVSMVELSQRIVLSLPCFWHPQYWDRCRLQLQLFAERFGTRPHSAAEHDALAIIVGADRSDSCLAPRRQIRGASSLLAASLARRKRNPCTRTSGLAFSTQI